MYYFIFSFLAYNLVVELHVDIGVFIPTCHTESITVELLQAVELLVDVRHRSQIDDMVADARYHLHRAVGENIELFDL